MALPCVHARTTPARVLRSAIPMAECPNALDASTSSPRLRRAPQEAEVGGGLQLGEARGRTDDFHDFSPSPLGKRDREAVEGALRPGSCFREIAPGLAPLPGFAGLPPRGEENDFMASATPSPEQAMHPPFGGFVGAVEAGAEEPEAGAGLVFDAVVVANAVGGGFLEGAAPPFLGQAFGAFGPPNAVSRRRASGTAPADRRG